MYWLRQTRTVRDKLGQNFETQNGSRRLEPKHKNQNQSRKPKPTQKIKTYRKLEHTQTGLNKSISTLLNTILYNIL